MTKNNDTNNGTSEIVPGKSAAAQVARLPLAEKLMSLRKLEHKERLDRILADPDAKRIFREFEPQELYWMVKDIGENDVSELLELCAPEQIEFFLDMDCWEKGVFCEEKFIKWLDHLLQTGEQRLVELIPHLELEFLVLSLMKEIVVGGGIGDMVAESEKEHDWDHSFDGNYMILFKKPANSALIGKFIDIIYRNFNPLYLTLMESVRNETIGEIEELSYRFRSARLADWGFPELEDALSIYGYFDPETYTPAEDKIAASAQLDRPDTLPLPIGEETLLKKALVSADSDRPMLELQYLINNAVVAEGVPLSDRDDMKKVLQRVYGYLNIALEYLCGDDAVKAGAVLEKEHLKILFQLGRSIILPLRKRAEELDASVADAGYAANKVLLGLKTTHPEFYRGLDPDTIDGYREFSSMADIRMMTAFLERLKAR